jgi:hypothetical protein
MNSYMIQYPIAYSSCGALQSPIVFNNNLVKNIVCATIKQGEDSNEQNSKGMQPRWCPSGLSHTQKRKLQWMRKQRSMEQPTVVTPMRSTTTKQVWRPKQVVPWVHSKFMANKAIITLRSKNMDDVLLIIIFLPILIIIYVFLARKLCHKTGGHVLTPKIGKTR